METNGKLEGLVEEAASNENAKDIEMKFKATELRQRNNLQRMGDELNKSHEKCAKKAKQLYDSEKNKPGRADEAKAKYSAAIEGIKNYARSMFISSLEYTEKIFTKLGRMIKDFVKNHWKALLLGLVTGALTAIGIVVGGIALEASTPVIAGAAVGGALVTGSSATAIGIGVGKSRNPKHD